MRMNDVRRRGSSALVVLALLCSLLLPARTVRVAAQAGSPILEADFDSNAEGFGYQDDAFRGTGAPAYASGTWLSSGGYDGGGLRVVLGGIDNATSTGMSGGWRQTFNLSAGATVTVLFWYKLTQTSEYENDEFSQALVSLNGTLHGQGSNDYVAQIRGDGNGGSAQTTGWQQFQFSVPLDAGSHTLIIGGYNNKKTYNNESSEILVDQVLVTAGNVPPVADAGLDQTVVDNDSSGYEGVTLDGSSSYDVDGMIVSWEWRDGGVPIANSEVAVVNVALGTHTLTLTVTDNEGQTDSDDTIITVNAPGAAQAIVDRLDINHFKANIKALNDFGDRCQMTGCSLTSYNNAQNWLQGQLEAMGYTVERHYYTYNSSTRSSLYVTKVGTVHPDQMYMVACHLDGRGGGGAADDNGSGCSLLMEAARVLAQPDVETDMSVRLFWWGNEETGLHGSTAYRDTRYSLQGIENPPGSGIYPEPTWLGNITHDMVLYDHGNPAQPEQIPGADIDVEYRAGTTYATQSRDLANVVAAAAAKYSPDYPAEVNDYSTNTDDTPYHNYCPAISVRENRRLNEIAGVHPYYHTSGDVYENYSELDFLLGFNTVQMTTGAIAELANARIVSANNPPVADPQSVSTAEDSPVSIVLTGSDPEGDPLTFSVVGGPAHGSLSGNAPTLTYTPHPDYNGADSFDFVAHDGGRSSAPATVEITVTPVNDPPQADGQALSVDEDATLAITLTGSDIEGDPLTFAVITPPTHGILTGTAANLTYSPGADYSGPDAFTFVVNDGQYDSPQASVDIAVQPVNDPPLANPQSLATDEDTPLAITLSGSDPEGDPLTFSLVTGPANGALSGTLPNLTYTPNADFNGSDGFAFVADDGTDFSPQAAVGIAVDPVNDPPLADGQVVSTVEDMPLAITLTGSDVDGDSLTFTVTGGPGNGTLSGQAPDLTYTPASGFVGADSFTFVANDGVVGSAPATVEITVNEYNEPPVADPQTVQTDEDVALAILLTGSDPDGDALTFTVVDGPQHGALSGSAPDLLYAPDADYYGPDSFTFRVNDGLYDSPLAVVGITIQPVNDAPQANSQSVTTAEDQPLGITLTGSDPEGAPLTYLVTDGPDHGSLSGSAPNLTYTPGANYHGFDSFAFRVNDGALESNEAIASLTITPVNDPPLAVDDAAATQEDTPFSLRVQDNDTDADGDSLTVTSVTQPAHGTAVLNPNQTVGYTPASDYCGADSFGYVVSDGQGGSDGGSVSVTVTCVNDPPLADAQSVSTAAGTPLAITLTGSDVDGDPLTFLVQTDPAHGQLSGTAPDLTYTPATGYSGTDAFTFAVNDGQVSSAPAAVEITVQPSGPVVVFADDFEQDLGWIPNPNNTDTASSGMWERADPQSTSSSGPKQLGDTVSGQYDLVTGGAAGSGAGSYDIDNGVTSIRSPGFRLPEGMELVLSFQYYLAHLSNSSDADFLRVKVVGSSTQTLFEELGARNDDDAVWASASVSLNAFAGQTVYLLVEAADASGASLVEAAIDDVSVIAAAPATPILEAAFDSGSDGLAYQDDVFRGTSAPAYASGTWQSSAGYSGGGLQVVLGGLDNSTISGMSGGWQGGVTLDAPAQVVLSFYYRLTQTSEYESDEYSQVLLSVDGALVGESGDDYVAQIVGDGNGGSSRSTGWRSFHVELGTLPAGPHSFVLGGYNNKKTYNNESTELVFDDLVVAVR